MLRELSFQPRSSHVPVALYGPLRRLEYLGGLFKGESTEKMKFDDPCLAWVELREVLDGLIQNQEVDGPVLRRKQIITQGDLTLQSSPLAGLPRAR